MPILNYTTQIAVEKTLSEITGNLATHGARSVTVGYEKGAPASIEFLIDTTWGMRTYRLPANLDGVWRTMCKQYAEGKMPRKFVTREQAARVGWRIVKDWVSAQMAFVEAQMVRLEEIMLPYMIVEGRTLYQLMDGRRLALPEARDESDQ